MDTGTDVSTIGPTQLVAVGFKPRVDFISTIIKEIDRLEGHGVLRLLDLLVLTIDDDGSLTRVEIADEDFGDLLIAGAQLDPFDVFAMFEGRGVEVLQSVRAQALVQSLVPGSGLALILVEHRWARPLFDSIAGLGGVVFSEGFIGEQTEKLVGVQLAALEDTARVIDEAYAAQTEAVAASTAAIEAAAHKADEAAVAASVSAVELQVLRYLPTKMTFALVADKLGISRSAAKERAERAYKKLGVHNRADAVARARELGLIRHSWPEGPKIGEETVSGTDKAKNKLEELAGKAKEAVGKVTGDTSTENEGKRDQVKSNLKDAGEKVKDAFKKK